MQPITKRLTEGELFMKHLGIIDPRGAPGKVGAVHFAAPACSDIAGEKLPAPEQLGCNEKISVTDGPARRFANIEAELRVHYVEYGSSDGEPVVFLHGWPDSWFSFSRVLPLLPQTLRSVAVDLRGFGDSDRPLLDYSIPEMAADIVAFLDALEIGRAMLVGHSFGSFVARQLAIAHPDRVTAMVLIGTGFATANSVTKEVQGTLQDLPDPIPEEFARDFQSSTVHHPVPPEFFERIVTESLKLPPRLWRLALDRLLEYDDTDQLSRIEVPTLLLWGDRDALFSRSDQDRILAALPDGQLAIYEETGHCPNWERPDRVSADIAEFHASR
jgi:pimeloyl-ACP methyl ester carboxylesterase